MSWDILIINSSKPVDFGKDEWANFESRTSTIKNIQQIFPDINWSDPSWGVLNNKRAVIEFNVGNKEDMGNTFMLHVRGGQNPTSEIVRLCQEFDWIAFDISGEKFIDNNQPTLDSFKQWESYRDKVINGTNNKKPWWKFW